MTDEPSLDLALEANRRFAETFSPSEAGTPRLAVLLCMDARIDPIRALGLRYGHAHIIRNAGGRMADALRSLAISQRLVGTTEVAVIHHTECAMTTFSDADMHRRLREEAGVDAGDMAFLPFRDLDESVREDLRIYRESPLVRHDVPVRGFIYEVATGLLREVTEQGG
ncbi:MAG: carbonic anhydrase [Chloroflexi bacterium]|nr:carbonic anhydrase [Chloroflexota bacterium]